MTRATCPPIYQCPQHRSHQPPFCLFSPPSSLPSSPTTQNSCTNPYLYHYCDTTEGDSGSAMWGLGGVPAGADNNTASLNVSGKGRGLTSTNATSSVKAAAAAATVSVPDGASGGPALYIRAIHTIEWDNGTTADGTPLAVVNSAVAITPAHYAAILQWIEPSFEVCTAPAYCPTALPCTALPTCSTPQPVSALLASLQGFQAATVAGGSGGESTDTVGVVIAGEPYSPAWPVSTRPQEQQQQQQQQQDTVLIQQQATGGEGASASFYSAQQARAMEMAPYLEQTFAVQAADPPPLPPQENGGRGLRWSASRWLMRGKGDKGKDNAGGRDLQQFGGMGMMMFGDTGSGDGGIGRLPWAWIWAWSFCSWGVIWIASHL